MESCPETTGMSPELLGPATFDGDQETHGIRMLLRNRLTAEAALVSRRLGHAHPV
jgi:hypothetical protein